MKKAQVQAISMVLMAGIVLALAGAAYFWGAPLIEKRTTVTDVSTAKSFILELDKQIVDVARSGGSKTVNIPRITGASLKVNQSGNEILFRFVTAQAMLGMGEGSMSVPVETYDDSDTGVYGGSPRIIKLYGEPVDNNQYLMTLRLKYRELVASNPDKGYKIAITDGGNLAGSDAQSRVSANFVNITTDPTGAENGGDLIETYINVTIS